jgi:hypothetical protein
MTFKCIMCGDEITDKEKIKENIAQCDTCLEWDMDLANMGLYYEPKEKEGEK